MNAEQLIEEMKDVFALAGSGFEEFAKTADKSCAGNYSHSASAGNYSHSASAGDYSHSASAGDYSKAASAGDYSQAASSGDYSACAAVGYRAAVCGDLGNLLMASEYVKSEGRMKLVGGKADLVDGKKLKPGRWYIVEGGGWVEVDFTDGIFTYVISSKKNLKKVRTEKGEILYIVYDDQGNAAHGETVAKARQELIFKATAKFDGALPEQATGAEWVAIYRGATGACSTGTRLWCESQNIDLAATFTKAQVLEMTRGAYNAEKLAAHAYEQVG